VICYGSQGVRLAKLYTTTSSAVSSRINIQSKGLITRLPSVSVGQMLTLIHPRWLNGFRVQI